MVKCRLPTTRWTKGHTRSEVVWSKLSMITSSICRRLLSLR